MDDDDDDDGEFTKKTNESIIAVGVVFFSATCHTVFLLYT
jgi:hypothetical protein